MNSLRWRDSVVENAFNGRWYEIAEGTYVPSVTTMLKGGTPKDEWFYKFLITASEGNYDKYLKGKSEASRVGIKTHDIIEHLLSGKEYTFDKRDPEVQRAVTSFVTWWQTAGIKSKDFLAIEKFLYCLDLKDGEIKYPYAGKPDLITRMPDPKNPKKKIVALIDWKTSKRPDDPAYGLQLSCYKQLWDATQKEPIDKMYVVWCKKNFKGAIPGKTSRFLYEMPFDPKGVECANYLFNKFYSKARETKASPSFRADLIEEFQIEI